MSTTRHASILELHIAHNYILKNDRINNLLKRALFYTFSSLISHKIRCAPRISLIYYISFE